EHHGDRANAAYAQHLEVRRLLLIGRLDEAEQASLGFDPAKLPPALRAAHELAVAGIAVRRLRIASARAALGRAGRAAKRAGIAALVAEVENAAAALEAPAARAIARGGQKMLRLEEVEALLASHTLVIDACRNLVCH